MGKGIRGLLIAATLAATLANFGPLPASATPVCAGTGFLAPPPCPRVFNEPALSTNWVQFGPDALGRSELADGMNALQTMYPNYVKFEKLSDVLHDPWAVSIGADGIPPWDPKDSKDGLPVYVSEVTDFRVPDKDKSYVIITEAHSAEPCGREAAVREVEDLAIGASGNPLGLPNAPTSLDNGNGPNNNKTTLSVADLLKKEHVFFIWISPDGWRSGDQDPTSVVEQESHTTDRPTAPSQEDIQYLRATYSEENGRGVNTNREAPSVGWIFHQPPGTYPSNSPGLNPTLTEPEAIASWRFIEKILANHKLDAFMDIHGPLPLPADILIPDGQFDPHRMGLMEEMALRVKEKMDQSVGQHIMDPGLYDQLRSATGGQIGNGSTDWTTIGQAWDLLSYTVSGAWGFWMAQGGSAPDGIGTDYENNCYPGSAGNSDWVGPVMQFFIDSARAAIQTTLVQAVAQRSEKTVIDTKGQVGYVYNPAVFTDANNPTPPDPKFPGNTPGGNPYFPHGFPQYPYHATSMKYLEDTSKLSTRPFIAVNPSDVAAGQTLSNLNTLVLVNNALPSDATGNDPDPRQYYDALKQWVVNGGNLILTDGAVKALVNMGIITNDSVKYGYDYVGYIDIQDSNDPLIKGVFAPGSSNRRQTYDPVALGYEIRAERDGHWASGTPDSQTHNMAPIWMVDRATWEKLNGHTVATTDPLDDPNISKHGSEGSKTDKVSLGTMPLGKGRIVFFGAMLPDPNDHYQHPFGLSSYAPTYPAQHIFQQAITFGVAGTSTTAGAAANAPSLPTGTIGIPNTSGGRSLPLWLGLAFGLLTLGVLRRALRRSDDLSA